MDLQKIKRAVDASMKQCRCAELYEVDGETHPHSDECIARLRKSISKALGRDCDWPICRKEAPKRRVSCCACG